MPDHNYDDLADDQDEGSDSAEPGSFDFKRLLTAVGASLALLVVSYGFGQGTRYLRTSRPARAPAVADAPPKQPDGPPPVRPVPRDLAKKPNVPVNPVNPLAPRPEAKPADRDTVKMLQLAPPQTLAILPEKVPQSEPLLSSMEVIPGDVFFSGLQTGQAAVLSLQRRQPLNARLAIIWNRVDVRTGKPLGDDIELWPWFKGAEDATLNPAPTGWALAALSADGNHLALRDPADQARLDVWEATGKRLLGFTPYQPRSTLQWLGWSADGRLLTVGDGKLTAWDVTDGHAVYEVSIPGSNLAAVLSPGRTWVALATKGEIYVFETLTGRCLGHLGTADPQAEGWLALAISPDGQRLCGITRHRPPAFAPAGVEGWMTRWKGAERAGDVVWGSLHDLYTWDLSTNKLTGPFTLWTDMASPQWNPLHWCGQHHILIGGRNLIDLDHRVLLKAYIAPRTIVPKSLDGQLWYLSAATKPDAKTATLRAYSPPSPPADGAVVFHPGTPVAVEAECGNPERNKQVVTALRSHLDHEGYKDGPGGWTMRVKVEPFDTKERLPQDPANAPSLPAFLITINLVSSEGTEAVPDAYSAVFQRKRSKYYVRPRAGQSDTVENYNFGGKDRNQAILDEIWEQQLATPAGWAHWPRGVVKVQDKLLLLPQTDDQLR